MRSKADGHFVILSCRANAGWLSLVFFSAPASLRMPFAAPRIDADLPQAPMRLLRGDAVDA